MINSKFSRNRIHNVRPDQKTSVPYDNGYRAYVDGRIPLKSGLVDISPIKTAIYGLQRFDRGEYFGSMPGDLHLAPFAA